jgi:hypothetical protein
MGRYAKDTTVSSARSKMEIEKTLAKFGARAFMYGWEGEHAAVAFQMYDRHIKFILPLPSRDDFSQTETGRERAANVAEKAYEQAVKQKWRSLALIIKAKLVAVDDGILSFEEAFLAHIVLPDKSTVGQFILPQIARAYDQGSMPKMLPEHKG